MNLIFEQYLVVVKCLGQRSLTSKVLSKHTDRQTHTRQIAMPEPL